MYDINTCFKKNRLATRLLSLLVVLLPQFLNAENQKIVFLENEKTWIASTLCYTLEDTTHNLNAHNILKAENEQLFTTNDSKLEFNKNRNANYWKKIILINKSNSQTWLIEFPDPHIEEMEFSVLNNHNLRTLAPVGFNFPFSNKDISHKNFVFELNFPESQELTIYVKIHSKNYCGFTPVMRSIKNFSQYFFQEYYYLGIYYGIILILIVYNLIMGFFIKEKIHFYYCFYILCCSFFTFSEDGIGFQFLWANTPYLNTILRNLSPVFLLVSFVLYTEQFLSLRKSSVHIFNFVVSSAILYLFLHLLDDIFSQTQHLFYIIPFALTFYAGIKLYQEDFKPARFFIIGNSVILISFIVYFLRIKGWIASNIYTVYLFNYGFVFESVVLSISVADKVKNTKDKAELAQKEVINQLKVNDELQHKVNLELETKVNERTLELSEKTKALSHANQALEKLKKELYEMNSKMDINIYQLKKEVIKEKEARILHQEVSYEEFKLIFTEEKCIHYLEQNKWKKGFVCLKCGNTKANRGSNKHTLKCTTCSHQESITAHTLFHGVRFPLTKAFYLVYFFTQKGKNTSYEELSEKIEVNKNTVWKFHKKIEQALMENPKLANEWKDILLKAPSL